MWSNLPADEVERRRLESVEALRERERAEFDERYQQHCDTEYWRFGQCCAGCDYWQSDSSNVGCCAAAGIVSGEQVLASMGVTWSTYTPPPGLPCTTADFWCGKFKDDFDWSTLSFDYLKAIGAVAHGQLKQKPRMPREQD